MKRINNIGYKDIFGNPQYIHSAEGITNIIEHAAQGEGDKWYWEVTYEDGTSCKIFDVLEVNYKKETT